MRKILIEYGGKDTGYFQGLARAFQSIQKEVGMIDSLRFSVFDAFARFTPDVFICKADRVTRGVEKCLLTFPNDGRSRSCRFVCYEEDSSHEFWGIIDRKRIDVSCSIFSGAGLQILPGVDTLNTSRGTPQEKYGCDFAFVGEYQDWMYPYFEYLTQSGKNIRIYSHIGCDFPQNVGGLHQAQTSDAIVSAKRVIDLDGMSDRFLQILYCGVGQNGLFLDDPNKRKLFPDLSYFSNLEEFKNAIETQKTFASPPKYGSEVYLRHTTQSRAQAILNAIA